MIAGVSASTPSMRREKQARRQAIAHLSVGLSHKAASRLVRVTTPSKKHVEEGAFTLSGAMLKAWTETE
jgi:hypothetical protein